MLEVFVNIILAFIVLCVIGYIAYGVFCTLLGVYYLVKALVSLGKKIIKFTKEIIKFAKSPKEYIKNKRQEKKKNRSYSYSYKLSDILSDIPSMFSNTQNTVVDTYDPFVASRCNMEMSRCLSTIRQAEFDKAVHGNRVAGGTSAFDARIKCAQLEYQRALSEKLANDLKPR